MRNDALVLLAIGIGIISWAAYETYTNPARIYAFVGVGGIALIAHAFKLIIEDLKPVKKREIERRKRNVRRWPERRQYQAYSTSYTGYSRK